MTDRNAILEQAARIVDAEHHGADSHDTWCALTKVAQSIRALKQGCVEEAPTLSDKITSAEQFDATPAGKALKEYRTAMSLWILSECELVGRRAWAAERALIEEIKSLQRQAHVADIWHDLIERAHHLAVCVFKSETRADRDRAQHNAAVLANAIDHAKQNERNEKALQNAQG